MGLPGERVPKLEHHNREGGWCKAFGPYTRCLASCFWGWWTCQCSMGTVFTPCPLLLGQHLQPTLMALWGRVLLPPLKCIWKFECMCIGSGSYYIVTATWLPTWGLASSEVNAFTGLRNLWVLHFLQFLPSPSLQALSAVSPFSIFGGGWWCIGLRLLPISLPPYSIIGTIATHSRFWIGGGLLPPFWNTHLCSRKGAITHEESDIKGSLYHAWWMLIFEKWFRLLPHY